MYNLYKKVFKNLYLSKLIFKFVRYENWDDENDEKQLQQQQQQQYKEELDYSIYEKIRNSYRLYDLNIEKLLSLKMYKVFDDLIEFYFKVVIFNKEKYWKYQGIELKSKGDLIQLLQYRELGFNRFLKFYENFKNEFKRNKTIVLSSASIGGNWEIYKFLLYQDNGYFKFYSKLPIITNFYGFNRPSVDIYYNVVLASITPSPQADSSLNGLLYSCGNNELYFKELLESNIISFDKQYHSKFNVQLEISMAVRLGYKVYLKYLIENEPYGIGSGIGQFRTVEQYVSELVFISLTLSDLELAKLILNTPRLISKFNVKTLKYDLSTIPIDYNVLKYYKNIAIQQHQQQQQLNSKNTILSIEQINYFKNYLLFSRFINFNFQLVDWDHLIIKLVVENSSFDGYMPNFIEFKYLVKNELLTDKLLKKSLFWDQLLQYITNVLFDVEYLKFVLDFSKDHPILSNKLVLKPCCFDSKLPIVKFLFENYQNYKAIQFTKFENSVNQNQFFGDSKSVEYILNHKSNNITQQHESNLFNGLFFKSIRYYEILEYCLNNTKLLFQESFYKQYISSYGIGYNGFKIFKLFLKRQPLGHHISSYFITKNVFDKNNRFISSYLISNPMIHHYLCRSKSIDFDHSNLFYYKNELSIDLNLLKQFQQQQFLAITNCHNIVLTLFKSTLTKLSVLQYLVYQLSFKPSNLNITDKSDAQLFSFCLKNSKLLCFFIHNDSKWIENNIDKIIFYSCQKKSLFYLNLILSSNNNLYSNDFKLKTIIKFIFYSILKSDDITNLNTSLWFLKLNCQGIEITSTSILETENNLLSIGSTCRKFYLKFKFVLDSITTIQEYNNSNNIMIYILNQISNYYIRYPLPPTEFIFNNPQDILIEINPIKLNFNNLK